MGAAVQHDPSLYLFDPIFSRKKAAEYLGRSAKTLDRLNLERDPLPGTSKTPEMGYRLSTLNRYLANLKSAKSRTRKVKK